MFLYYHLRVTSLPTLSIGEFEWTVIGAFGLVVLFVWGIYSLGKRIDSQLQVIANCVEKLNFKFGYTDEEFEKEILERSQRDSDIELERRTAGK